MTPPSLRPRGLVHAAVIAAVFALGCGASAHDLKTYSLSVNSAQQSFDPSVYLPSADEMSAALNASPEESGGSYTPVSAPAPATAWGAAARYVFPGTPRANPYVFDISVSVYPTAADAASALDEFANDLLAANSPSREYPENRNRDWADHAREVRYNFTDPETGAVRGSYTQLIREGCALVMVNAQGGPNVEFIGPAVDNDRGLLLEVISQEMDDNLRATPAPCSGE